MGIGTLERRWQPISAGSAQVWALGSGLGAAAVALTAGSGVLDSWARGSRYTVRVAALWFAATYVARPLHVVMRHQFTLAWQQSRRALGLAFAGALGVHLVCVVVELAHGGRWPRPVSLAYLLWSVALLAAMLVTSNLRVQRWLGPAWRTLHRLGLHTLWLALAGGLALSATKGEVGALLPLMLLLWAAAVRLRARLT